MFVFCDNCMQHYDDSSQSDLCKGVGSIHNKILPDLAEDHVRNARAAWADWTRRNPAHAAIRDAQNSTTKPRSSRVW